MEKKSTFKKLWTFVSYVAGGYAIMNQLKSLSQAKDDLYVELSPEQKLQWNKIFGPPGSAKISMPRITQSYVAPQTSASDLDKIKAGV